jgi:hypothetical protein
MLGALRNIWVHELLFLLYRRLLATLQECC